MRATYPKSKSRRAGFTLLEVMMAVSILSLVWLVVYSTWSTSMRAWKRGLEVSATFQRQRVILDALGEITRSAVFLPSNLGVYDLVGDREESLGDSISFVTTSDALLPPSEVAVAGLRRVTIGMQRDAEGRPFLGISNRFALDASEDEEDEVFSVLSYDVIGFRIRYRDVRTGSWQDEWTEPSIVPVAVEFQLAFADAQAKEGAVFGSRIVEFPAALYSMRYRGQSLHQMNMPRSEGGKQTRNPESGPAVPSGDGGQPRR